MRATSVLVALCLLLAVAMTSHAQYTYSRLDEVGSYAEDWVSLQWGFVDGTLALQAARRLQAMT